MGVDARSKQLRSAMAFQFLVTSLDKKVNSQWLVCNSSELLHDFPNRKGIGS